MQVSKWKSCVAFNLAVQFRMRFCDAYTLAGWSAFSVGRDRISCRSSHSYAAVTKDTRERKLRRNTMDEQTEWYEYRGTSAERKLKKLSSKYCLGNCQDGEWGTTCSGVSNKLTDVWTEPGLNLAKKKKNRTDHLVDFSVSRGRSWSFPLLSFELHSVICQNTKAVASRKEYSSLAHLLLVRSIRQCNHGSAQYLSRSHTRQMSEGVALKCMFIA